LRRSAATPRTFLKARVPALKKGVTRFVEGIRRLIEQLGAKDAEALAYSTVAELAGALTLARAQTNPTRSATTLRISRRSAKRRLGLDSRR